MFKPLRRPLAVALSATLGMLLLVPVAQAQTNPRRHKQEAAQAEAKPPEYPNATRQSPTPSASPKAIKLLQAMQDAYGKDDWAGVMAKAEEIGALSAANAYDKSFAFSMAGNAAANADNQAKAADYFAKAIAANGLDNDSHYATMYNLAVIQYGEEKYADALATMDRFLAETKSEKADQQGFRAGILANLERYDEAAAIYKTLVAKNPTDKRLLMNAVSVLQSANKFDDANVLLADAYKRGMLTDARELRALYIGYMNAQRWTEAQKVVDDGVAKGILQPGPELARDYQILAQTAYANDNMPLAIEMYKRAAPMAADGEAYLNLAKVLDMDGKKAEAKTAAKSALDKGIKKPEDAKRILAR